MKYRWRMSLLLVLIAFFAVPATAYLVPYTALERTTTIENGYTLSTIAFQDLATDTLVTAEEETPCTTIIVGKDASADGSVIVGHNEDDGGDAVIRLHVVPRNTHPNSFKLTDGRRVYKEPHTDLVIPVPGNTYAYVWSEMPGMDFSDSYINEYGVIVVSDNAGGSREDNPELVDGGIRYYLRRLAIEQAKTAREATKIIGELVEKYGYGHGGRVYIVADPNEAWAVQVVYGKHWLAQRVPDDGVVVIPNKYVSRYVDLSDTENFMGSKDLIEYAKKRGWYDPEKGPFDFVAVYGNPRASTGSYNIYRQQTGLYLLTGEIFPINDLPFSAKPKRKLTVQDVMEALRAVSSYGFNSELAKNIAGSFHNNVRSLTVRPISVWTTQESAVFQLRSDLPPEIGVVYWRAPNIPDINAYVAWYPVAMIKAEVDFPRPYAYGDQYYIDFSSAYWAFRVFTNAVDYDYTNKIDSVRKIWDEFEKKEFEMQPIIESYAFELYNKGKKKEAATLLAYYSSGLGMDAYTTALELLRDWQS